MPPRVAATASAAAPKAGTRATASRAASGRSKAKREAEAEDPAECATAAAAPAPEEARADAMVAEKENAVAVVAAPSAVPATPAPRAKALLPCPSPSPARTPLQPTNGNTINATPAPAARRVACTPSVAAAPPPPLPPRPAVQSTDATLLRALDTVFKKVDAVATGFAATHGPSLDVAPLYAELASAKSAKDLAMVCHKLGLYLMREWKLVPAQQLQTMSAQYMRTCKVLPHLTAEMEYFAVTCQAKAISVCQTVAVTGLMDACRSASDKLIADCAAQAANDAADAVQRFSFHRTILWTHYEMMHMQVQRALTVMQGGQLQLAHPLIATARQDASLFLSKLSSMLQSPLSLSQRQQVSEATRKLVDDLMLLISTATMLSRPDDSAWTELILSLLENEVRECSTVCNDVHLTRWRTAKMLQQAATAQSADRRSKGIAELQSLPVSHSNPVASPSSKSPPSTLPCLSTLGVLMSLYEQAFLTPLLAPAPAAAEALRSSLLSAISRVNADPSSTDEDKRYAHGLYFLALSYLTAATPPVAGAASPASPLHVSYRHSYQSLKHFRSMMLRTTEEMAAAATPSTATPVAPFRRHWLMLLDYTRCLYFRAVLSEHQGLHALAQSLLENAMSTLDQVLYQSMQRSASADSSAAIPFASLVVGKLHRARIHAKLDRWDAVQELLAWSQISTPSSAAAAGACGAPFLGPYAVHTRQVMQWLQRVGSSEADLSEQMQRMNIQESKVSESVEPCAQCNVHLNLSVASLPLVPCSVDTLMNRLSSPSVSRSLLDSVLVSHALWRPPPLMRLVHHALARLLMADSDHAGAAFHMHEAMALTARHEAWNLREGSKEGQNTAAGTALQMTSFAEERKLFDEAFVASMPADWTVCSIDMDAEGFLLLSRMQRDSVSTARVAAASLLSISAAFTASLCRGNEASALAKQYNSTVKPALLNRPDGKKPPAKDLAHAKSMVTSIESNRTAADNGISECCVGMERFLGAHIELLHGSDGGPVILVLGPSVVHLPWENLPSLQSQCMTRMAAWSFIVALRAQVPTAASSSLLPAVSTSDGYFVLNPQSNLSNAESHLRSVLTADVTWRGSCGTPDINAWSQALQQRAYFTYVGHNGGEEFVPTKTIRAMIKPTAANGQRNNDKQGAEGASRSASSSPSPSAASSGVLSVCLQIGCSSALQQCAKSGPHPSYDCDGLSLAYQIAGCPAMFGCLWNVTDDIDQWTTHVITQLQASKDRESATAVTEAEPETTKKKAASKKPTKKQAAVASAAPAGPACASLQSIAIAARAACKYAHLNGASIICYGLPISS